ncbi:WG repeat-containing protein [Kerstersia similis]|uniref:WG repeat-containing protein n=1 Tax=Kerstersia similis TaxID=206505 RepID=UPI0039EF9BD1
MTTRISLPAFSFAPGLRLTAISRPAAWLAACLWLGMGWNHAAHANGNWYAGCSREGEANYCYRPYAEGLAAVQLGSLDESLPAWGYLNAAGELAIAPAFEDAASFQNGLAAVARDNQWGYIDSTGAWVIAPAFEQATGFNAEGTAIVEANGRVLLIDRSGKTIKTFPLGVRSRGFRPGQALAMAEQETAPLAWNIASGKLLSAPDAVGALEVGYSRDAWNSKQWLAAQTRQSDYRGKWGLMKLDGSWLATPDALQSVLAPISDGQRAAVSREAGYQWQLVDLQGNILKEGTYAKLDILAPGYWLGVNDQSTELLGPDLQPLGHWSGRELHVQRGADWGFAVVNDGKVIHILNDGQPLVTLSLAHSSVRVFDGRIWVFDKSPDGDDGYGLGEAGVLAQIYDRQGQALLAQAQSTSAGATARTTDAADTSAAESGQLETAEPAAVVRQPASRKQLDGYSVRILADARVRSPDADRSLWPLAILKPRQYDSPLTPAILTVGGEIVSASDWRDVQASENGGPLIVTLQNQLTGALDAQGNWLVQPEFRDIEAFQGAYARALPADSRQGWRSAVVIDQQGRRVELPAKVASALARVEHGLAVYRAESAGGQERMFLWDIAAGRDVSPEGFQELYAFSDGYASAQQKGKWGLLNARGNWIVPPSRQYSPSVRTLPGGLLQVSEDGDSSQHRLYRLDGRQVGPLLNREISDLGRGQFQVTLADNNAVGILDTATGKVTLLPDRSTHNLTAGSDKIWLLARGDYRQGAIDARGNWRILPSLSEFNPFFVQPSGLARAVGTGKGFLVDEQGRRVLPALGDARPLKGMDRFVQYDRDGESLLVDRNGKEIARVVGPYSLEADQASEGLLPYSERGNSKYGFLDADGRRVIGAYFDKLGAMKDGRAVALRRERAGKAFGYIDHSGRYAILPEFTWATDFSEGRALVLRDRLVQYIDTTGAVTAYIGILCRHVAVIAPDDRVLWPAADKLQCLEKDEKDGAPVGDAPPPEPVPVPAAVPVPAVPAAPALGS